MKVFISSLNKGFFLPFYLFIWASFFCQRDMFQFQVMRKTGLGILRKANLIFSFTHFLFMDVSLLTNLSQTLKIGSVIGLCEEDIIFAEKKKEDWMNHDLTQGLSQKQSMCRLISLSVYTKGSYKNERYRERCHYVSLG